MHEKELVSLPDGLYATLTPENQQELWKQLLQKYQSVKEVSVICRIPPKNLYRYKEGNSGYPLRDLKKLLRIAHLKPQNVKIKTQRDGEEISVQLPIKIDESFSDFLGYLLGDGGIDMKGRVHFTAGDEKRVQRFEDLVQAVFGNVEFHRTKVGNRICTYMPKVLGIILNESFDIPKGSKVDSDIQIPQNIWQLMNRNMKKEFLKAFYECNGFSDRIGIAQSSNNVNKKPAILEQLHDIFVSFGLTSAVIQPSSIYTTQRGVRRRWVLRLLDKNDREKFLRAFAISKLSVD